MFTASPAGKDCCIKGEKDKGCCCTKLHAIMSALQKKNDRPDRHQVDCSSCGKESQQHHGLHWKKHCQQAKGGYLSPLLSAGGTTVGAPCLALGFLLQKRCGCTRPEESHKGNEVIKESVMRGEAQRDETCYPAEEKVQWRSYPCA